MKKFIAALLIVGISVAALAGYSGTAGTRDGFESITGTEDACKYTQELISAGFLVLHNFRQFLHDLLQSDSICDIIY